MKLISITLERFRQFQHTTVHFGDFNVIVGPNNSGKTTVLHAIRAFFSLMRGHVRIEGTPPKPAYHRRFLSGVEELVPTPDQRELWFEKRAGSPCKITATFDDGVPFSVVLKQQFGQVHVSAGTIPKNLTAAQITRYFAANIAFIPGLVGVLVDEPYATSARRNSLASKGRYSEIFRSSLHQLADRDQKLVKKLNGVLRDLFGLEVTTIRFDPEKDEYVTVRYRQDAQEYDVVSSGSGLQQVIQILTYLYLSHPTILLIDEPDAHLHSRLQSRLGTLFRRVADDLDAQVFLSTHSPDLIDTAQPNEVIIIDSSQRDIRPLGANAELISTLVAAEIVDNSALSRIMAAKKLVIVEDKDLSLYKVFDRAMATELFSPSGSAYVKSAEGVGNFQQYNDLAATLQSVVEGAIEVVFIQDRDGLPDFMADPYQRVLKRQGMKVHLLERHEMENYLVDPRLLVDAAGASNGKLTIQQAESAIVTAGKALKQAARRKCRTSAATANRRLPSSTKLKEAELEEKVDEWFDSLDSDQWQTVARVWPGKELLKGVRKTLDDDYGMQLREGFLATVVRQDHIAEDFRDLFSDLAKMPGQARSKKAKGVHSKKTSKKTKRRSSTERP